MKSTQKQPSCKKGTAHVRGSMKIVVKSKAAASGCDGRMMAKFLIRTIQVNLVDFITFSCCLFYMGRTFLYNLAVFV